ncbi:MAG: FeoB-associated Cys-rich membrane protein [Clostridiales bacterium]|nr:FeoB-associated Cys-rich membrane protein [Clostridiales bacterium]
MIDWVIENLVSIIIVLVIAVFAVLAVVSIVRNRRKGKTCSCGCEGCVYSGNCTKAGKEDPER